MFARFVCRPIASARSRSGSFAAGALFSIMGLAAAAPIRAQARVIYSFQGALDGAVPLSGLDNVNGMLFGTTSASSVANPGGTIFSITPDGKETVLYHFKGGPHDGGGPAGRLLDINGALYGTTSYGGGTGCNSHLGCGTVFMLDPARREVVLHAFRSGRDGKYPYDRVIDVNGTLYGTTLDGGGHGCTSGAGCGAVFKLTADGVETVLHAFKGGTDGSYPVGGLINVEGKLYGVTETGGAFGLGTVFSLTHDGHFAILYSFQGGIDGANPYAGLIYHDGKLFGTTGNGGGAQACAEGCGTVFSLGLDGSETILHTFGFGDDGSVPAANLIHVGNALYGTTLSGGARGNGTVFKIDARGNETVLHAFAGGRDGYAPQAGLTALNGALYGTTPNGGAFGLGTVFKVPQ